MRIPLSGFTLVFGLIAVGGSASAADRSATIMIDKVTCREMLKMGGDERDFTIIYMHGFINGTQNTMEFDGPKLTEATDMVLDACISNPDATILSVFDKVRG
jgi:hypothetical protein